MSIYWEYNELTKDTLIERLENLTGFVEELALGGNYLTEVPAFYDYMQLDALDELWLNYNRISHLVWGNIPWMTIVADFSHNQVNSIQVVGEYIPCFQLKVLRLNNNNLQTVERGQIPVSVEYLDLSSNRISALGDLSEVLLRNLDIAYNNLTTLRGAHLPLSLERLDIFENTISTVTNASHLMNLGYITPCRSITRNACGLYERPCHPYTEVLKCGQCDYFKTLFPGTAVKC